MFTKTDQITFYGIDDLSEKLDEIIKSLNLEHEYFDIKLIMSEAITNAFIHGNKKDKSKPIIVKWKLEHDFINISVKDSGEKNSDLNFEEQLDENDILSESGRGLFIISAYSDEVEYKDGCLSIKKLLKNIC